MRTLVRGEARLGVMELSGNGDTGEVGGRDEKTLSRKAVCSCESQGAML